MRMQFRQEIGGNATSPASVRVGSEVTGRNTGSAASGCERADARRYGCRTAAGTEEDERNQKCASAGTCSSLKWANVEVNIL